MAVARKFSCPRPNPASINTRSASAGAASTNPAFYYFPFLFIPSPSFPDPPPSQDQEPVKFGARFTDRQVSPGRGSWAWISRAISFSQIKHSGNKVWPFLLARARERSLLSFLPSHVTRTRVHVYAISCVYTRAPCAQSRTTKFGPRERERERD